MNYNVDAFTVFDKDWAVVTAGDSMDHFNAMTISWGQMGTLWFKPVATVFVRSNRYTYEFMNDSEYFTISWFDADKKQDLGVLGSKSGRDGDKIAETSLTPKALEHGVGFEEAKHTLVLKKMYVQEMDRNAVPADVLEKSYADGGIHTMYIGEVIDVIEG